MRITMDFKKATEGGIETMAPQAAASVLHIWCTAHTCKRITPAITTAGANPLEYSQVCQSKFDKCLIHAYMYT